MSKRLALLLVLCAAPAFAEPIPQDALNRDFTACMGNVTPQQDAKRAAYCNCVRDGMRNWDLNTYSALVEEQAKAASAAQVPFRIQELAKVCIAKVLK